MNVHVYACSYVNLYVYIIMHMYVIRFILQICNLQLTDQNVGFVTAMLLVLDTPVLSCVIPRNSASAHGNC